MNQDEDNMLERGMLQSQMTFNTKIDEGKEEEAESSDDNDNRDGDPDYNDGEDDLYVRYYCFLSKPI